jgi:hypothetical protein
LRRQHGNSCQVYKNEDQWSRIKDPDINPCSYSILTFDKEAQNIYWREGSLFNKWCWENWISACRKLKLDPCLLTCTSINSKWIKHLNVKPETLKLLQEGIGKTLDHISIGFLDSSAIKRED